jgi:23S rRNA (cytosine1962-C5)-methyltransferase
MPESQVVITERGVARIHAGHLWVYRSDVRRAEASAGDVVRVISERGRFLGRAFFSDRSQIAVRMLTRDDRPIDWEFFTERIRAAIQYREQVVQDTDACRLVYGEADLLPSVIVDRYGDYLVLQTLSQGSDRQKDELVKILQECCGPKGIVERNDPKVRLLEGLEQKTTVIAGDVPEAVRIQANGVEFEFNLLTGQKTGGFLDQRENRAAAAQYARGQVLDCFSYVGGFALTMAKNCAHVEAVDLSALAVAGARHNQRLNNIENVTFREANVFDLLKEYDSADRRFELIVLDPPAFAKNKTSVEAACRGYKEINLRALKLLSPGGYLVTCSCSHHISEALFLQIVAEAANDARRSVVVVERRTQGRDHPIMLTMPETHYIKCMIIKCLC